MKNLNSFANVERALEAERLRQIALLESGQRVEQVTLLFNAGTGKVKPLRSKEESHDYRYFPDPDLPPLVLSSTWVEEQRAALPELPEARRGRLERAFGLSTYDARVLTERSGARRLLRVGGERGRRAQDRGQLGDGRRDGQLQRDRAASPSVSAALAAARSVSCATAW